MCARSIRRRAETAAHWRLFTTHKLEDIEAARRIVGFYRKRWTIEQLFRTAKTKGFQIEALRQQEGPLQKLVTAIFIAAIATMQLVAERDGAAGRPLADALDPEDMPVLEKVCESLEGKTQKQKNPHPKGSLAYAAWVFARLGGWTGYYGKPGPIVMLQGLTPSFTRSNMDGNSEMCKSRSPMGEGQGEGRDARLLRRYCSPAACRTQAFASWNSASNPGFANSAFAIAAP